MSDPTGITFITYRTQNGRQRRMARFPDGTFTDVVFAFIDPNALTALMQSNEQNRGGVGGGMSDSDMDRFIAAIEGITVAAPTVTVPAAQITVEPPAVEVKPTPVTIEVPPIDVPPAHFSDANIAEITNAIKAIALNVPAASMSQANIDQLVTAIRAIAISVPAAQMSDAAITQLVNAIRAVAITVAAPVVNVPAPVVNVPAPVVNVPAPIVNVPAPVVEVQPTPVNVAAPVVNVPAPVVNVPAPVVNVAAPQVTMSSLQPNVFKPIQNIGLLLGQQVTVWTPATGKKFRLMGLVLSGSLGGTITIYDGSTVILVLPVTTAGTPMYLGDGIVSSVAGNALKVQGGVALTLNGTVWGREE